jgi:hypothetical protein
MTSALVVGCIIQFELLVNLYPAIFAAATFRFTWNSRAWMGTVLTNLDQMWNSMWNPSTSAAPPHQGTPGQIYGGDSHLQQ